MRIRAYHICFPGNFRTGFPWLGARGRAWLAPGGRPVLAALDEAPAAIRPPGVVQLSRGALLALLTLRTRPLAPRPPATRQALGSVRSSSGATWVQTGLSGATFTLRDIRCSQVN
jgi:hypothetical protein